jgi:hypothetical protein
LFTVSLLIQSFRINYKLRPLPLSNRERRRRRSSARALYPC